MIYVPFLELSRDGKNSQIYHDNRIADLHSILDQSSYREKAASEVVLLRTVSPLFL